MDIESIRKCSHRLVGLSCQIRFATLFLCIAYVTSHHIFHNCFSIYQFRDYRATITKTLSPDIPLEISYLFLIKLINFFCIYSYSFANTTSLEATFTTNQFKTADKKPHKQNSRPLEKFIHQSFKWVFSDGLLCLDLYLMS